MSNCRANSASVLSPLTAARATFALKAGVWFRRGRFVIVSPGLQPFWLLSGRNSTYPDVQISWASSIYRTWRRGVVWTGGRPSLLLGTELALPFHERGPRLDCQHGKSST